MKLLTIGTGKKGAEVSSLLARKGVKVNGVPLFKCYGVTNSVEELKSIKLSQKNKFYLMLGNRKVDVRSILNVILGRNEVFEGSLIITSLDDEYGVSAAIEFGERLMDYLDDPVICLGIVPPFENMSPAELRERIKKLKEVRTEAVRVGFKHCHQKKDYATIMAVATILPNNVIEEDEQLQMIYDMAEIRSE